MLSAHNHVDVTLKAFSMRPTQFFFFFFFSENNEADCWLPMLHELD